MGDLDTVRPPCQACGCPVLDAVTHARWHAELALSAPTADAPVTTVDPSTGDPTPPPADPSTTTRTDNVLTLRDQAATALTNNLAWLTSTALANARAADAAYLALDPPASAQTVAQVRALTTQTLAVLDRLEALTRQTNALIRLGVDQLDSTET